jgi:hypothetical protein
MRVEDKNVVPDQIAPQAEDGSGVQARTPVQAQAADRPVHLLRQGTLPARAAQVARLTGPGPGVGQSDRNALGPAEVQGAHRVQDGDSAHGALS